MVFDFAAQTLPSQTTFLSTQSPCSGSGGSASVPCTAQTLAQGGNFQKTTTIKVNADTLDTSASVSGSIASSSTSLIGTTSGGITLYFTTSADVVVSVSKSTTTVAGEDIVYTITVTNNG